MAAQAGHTYVQYFIPYDGDVEEHPNVFLVRKPQKGLTLGDIQQAFPLPGAYFFRAKAPYGKTHVWLDLNGADEQVPSFNTKVVLKIARLSAAPAAEAAAPAPPIRAGARAASSRETPAAASSAPSSRAAPAAAAAVAPQQAAHTTADMLGLFDSGSPTPAAAGLGTSGGTGARSSSAAPAATGGGGSPHVPDDFFSAAPAAAPAAAAAAAAASRAQAPAYSPTVGGGDAFWNTGAASPAVAPAAARPSVAPAATRGPIGGPIGGSRPTAAAPAKGGGGNLLTENLFGGF